MTKTYDAGMKVLGRRIINEYPDPTEAKEVWANVDNLLGLRYKNPILKSLMKEMMNMIDFKDSLSYQARVAEDRLEILRELILRLGKKKFGKPSAKVLKQLTAIGTESRLTALSDRILDVDSWKELLAL